MEAATLEKVDYRKKYHEFYSPPSDQVQAVTIPPMQFAMIDGKGAAEGPEQSPEFQNAIGALYGVTFTLKIGRKKAGVAPDYTIGPLEGLWWMTDGGEFDMQRPADWRWTLMIFQPEFITANDFAEAVEALKAKKSNPALDAVRLAMFDEGRVAQIMHIGPYAEEAEDIRKLDAYIQEHGFTSRGRHHEIYLGDPRRAKPVNLRTILRHPIS